MKNLNEEGYKALYAAGVTDDFLKTHGTCLTRSCPAIDDNVTHLAALNTTWKHLEVRSPEIPFFFYGLFLYFLSSLVDPLYLKLDLGAFEPAALPI